MYYMNVLIASYAIWRCCFVALHCHVSFRPVFYNIITFLGFSDLEIYEHTHLYTIYLLLLFYTSLTQHNGTKDRPSPI